MSRRPKQPEGSVTLAQWMAQGLTIAYARPNAPPQERHHANLRHGNELAQRRVDFIKLKAPEISHRRLLFTEAQRLHREAQRVAKTRLHCPLGEHIDTNYAEQLRQAALAVRTIAMLTD